MTITIVEAWHIKRVGMIEDGSFPDTGFDVVNRGVIEIASTEIRIFEQEDSPAHTLNTSDAKLCIQLSLIRGLHFSNFRSRRGNYRGGQIRVVGEFDRGFIEMLTIQMPRNDYLTLKEYLQASLA